MIKKLRIKFILINMLIVIIMLTTIFGLMYASTDRSLESQSIEMMDRIAMDPIDTMMTHDMIKNDVRLPYFSVRFDRDGNKIGVDGGFFDLSDEIMLDAIIDKARNSQETYGLLKDYNLRFGRYDSEFGESIVFADITSERDTLSNLARTLTLVGLAAFTAFLGISVLLARWAVKPVAQAWTQQKQFVADASHELKTPLTVIMTNAEMLNSEECSDADRKVFSGNISAMSVQMRGLVESLLELARMDNESKVKSHEKINFSEISTNSAMMFEPVFFEKNLTLNYEIEDDIWVNGSRERLTQLVDILLDNASKYADANGETRLTLKRAAHNHLILRVSDQGEPISDEDLKNIFKRFYRVDKVRAMNHSYGLGLSIASAICEEHKGRIHAESANGWNSFYVELPTLA